MPNTRGVIFESGKENYTANPYSSCMATLNIENPSGPSTVVTASQAGCSGAFQAIGAGSTPVAYSTIIVPPQALIQVMAGEGGAQSAPGDQTQISIGATVVNRMTIPGWFPGSTTSQNTIVPSQYYGASNPTSNGVEPELAPS